MNRQMIENMIKLVQILKAYPNGIAVQEIEKRLEINYRTLFRLRDHTCDTFKLTIESKPDPNGRTNAKKWVLLDKNVQLPTPYCIDDYTWILMQLALNRGGYVEPEKQKKLMSEVQSILDASFVDATSDVPVVIAKTTGDYDYSKHKEIFKVLGSCLRKKKCAWINYQSTWRGKEKRFEIAPYAIVDYSGFLYVIANVPYHDTIIRLALNRINSAELSENTYKIPRSFNAKNHISNAFGITVGKPFKLEVQLFNDAAIYAAERTWGKEQKIRNHRDASITLSFIASGEHEIRNWILSFGSNAIVKRPKRIVELVNAEYKTIAQRLLDEGVKLD